MLSYSLDLASLAAAYDNGTLTPEAVVRDIHREMGQHRGNAIWIHVSAQAEVESQARDLQARRAAGAVLPLYGIPFAVKDNIDVAGCPTTAACPEYAYTPAASAQAVQYLLDAGALFIGKTNLDQFATGLVGTRSPYGACHNAFSPEHISGGSSSGSAVAVALGLVSFALGTDTAGSGRVPAGFNNIVGLKPTLGRVSTEGVVAACRSLDCVSVFALACDDAERVLDVLAPVMEAATADARGATRRAAAVFRCGVPQPGQLLFFGDEHARAAFNRALLCLRAAGAQIVEIDYRPFAEAARLLYDGPWVAERYAAVGEFVTAHPQAVDPVVRDIIAGAARWSAVDAFKGYYRLADLKREAAAQWRAMDVLALPTTGTIYTNAEIVAAPLERNTHLGYYTNFANLFDLCGVAVPGPFRDDGLPTGVTLIGCAQDDSMLLEIGSRVHRESGVALGATPYKLPPTAARAAVVAADADDEIILAVVGAHLSGMPLNHQLTACRARLLEAAATTSAYRLYALPGGPPARPGLCKVAQGGTAIAVELWAMPAAAFGSFMRGVPAPLAIGTLALADGRAVKGFLCEGHALDGAADISAYGGWRAYMAHLAAAA